MKQLDLGWFNLNVFEKLSLLCNKYINLTKKINTKTKNDLLTRLSHLSTCSWIHEWAKQHMLHARKISVKKAITYIIRYDILY